MGFLDEYGVDAAADADTSGGYTEVDAGPYRFELTDVFVKEGSQKDPEKQWIIFEYLLDDEAGHTVEHSELFQLPEDPKHPTDPERKTLGRYVNRLVDLGVPREKVNDIDRTDLIGRTGSLVVFDAAGKGGNAGKIYKNIRNVRVDTVEAAPAAAAPVAAKAAPVARAARQTASANPFAPKG